MLEDGAVWIRALFERGLQQGDRFIKFAALPVLADTCGEFLALRLSSHFSALFFARSSRLCAPLFTPIGPASAANRLNFRPSRTFGHYRCNMADQTTYGADGFAA